MARSQDPIDPAGNPARPDRAGRTRGRVIVPAVVVGIIVVIFGIILGVGQCAAPDDRDEGSGVVSVVDGDPLVR